jgi:hypothetical protein
MAGNRMSLDIEQIYQSRMDALSSVERVQRSMAMLKWARENLARQIVAEKGEMPVERLKLEVARRMYAAEPQVVALIDRQLANVSL